MSNAVEFISYDGKYPNLCRGVLTLRIDGKEVSFGSNFSENKKGEYESFWESGGCICIDDDGFYYADNGEWVLDIWDKNKYPEWIRCRMDEMIKCMNENVEWGCCGGCI